jgi:hypothetical protein
VDGDRKRFKESSGVERNMIRDSAKRSALLINPALKIKSVPVTPLRRMIYPLL